MHLGLNTNVQQRAEDEARVGARETKVLILLALFLGMSFDYLFYGNSLGVSYPLYVFMLLGYFHYSAREHYNFYSKTGWFLLVVIILLSVTFALFDNWTLKALNFLTVPVLIVIYTLLVTNKSLARAHPTLIIAQFFERVLMLALTCAVKPFKFIGQALSSVEEGAGSSLKKQIGIGLAISLPILLLVIPLLASADLIFAHYLRNITGLMPNTGLFRLFLVTFISMYVFGYAWSFKYTPVEQTQAPADKQGTVDPIILVTALTVVNLVYLLFTSIQFSYLYGGASKVLPLGFTYAEYARQGFFELVAVTLLNFLILLIANGVMNQGRKSARAAKVLLSVLVAFTCNMLFSAHFKMSLYEQAYGYTELRIYVHVFMLFLAVAFIIALLKIWIKPVPMLKAIFVTALLFYIALNYMNVHGLVAKNNIQRYYRTGDIDANYLTWLGYDALPELIQLADDPNPEVAEIVSDHIEQARAVKLGKWMEYNHSFARTHKLIQQAE